MGGGLDLDVCPVAPEFLVMPQLGPASTRSILF